MSKGIVAAFVLAVGLLAGLPAQASVIYTSRSSTITGFSCPSGGDCVEQTQTSTDLSPFSGSLAVPSDPDHWSSYRVSQQSALTANQITVNMSAFKAQYDRDWSLFDLQFTVDAPTSFTMSGEFGHSWSSGDALISLTGPSTFGIADISCGGSGDYNSCRYSNENPFPPPYSVTTLAPGLYELLITASNTGMDYMGDASTSSANFTMTFAPTVPIPAAVWLFVTGLLGLRRWLPKGSAAATT
jgi:hypothetical protein